jgi:hypothetical protein
MLVAEQFSSRILFPRTLDQLEHFVGNLAMLILPRFSNAISTWEIANRVCDGYAIRQTHNAQETPACPGGCGTVFKLTL